MKMLRLKFRQLLETPSTHTEGRLFMKCLKHALVLGIIGLTAIPAQAAKLCEPEVQAVLSVWKKYYKEDASGSRKDVVDLFRREVVEPFQNSTNEGADLIREIIQSVESGRESQVEYLNRAKSGDRDFHLMRIAEYDYFLCRARALKGGSTTSKPTHQTAAAGNPSTASGTGNSSASGNLSSQQVASCSEEIKRKQIESQSWSGNVDDVAARLGQFQKSLFEGRCKGHPEAQAYIAGANKMIGYGGNAAGSGGGSQGGAQQQSGRASDKQDTPIVGTVLNGSPDSNQPQRSASGPPAMGHVPMGRGPKDVRGAFINPSKDRLAQEVRERERAQKDSAKRHEEEQRKKQAERAEAKRQREEGERRQLQAQTQARASERSNLEAKIRSALSGPGAVVQYIDDQTCQSIFTNTTIYWITVVWDYTVTINKRGIGIVSHQTQQAFELPPGQTRAEPIYTVYGSPTCRRNDKETWRVPGGAVTKKDNLNNYPYHLR